MTSVSQTETQSPVDDLQVIEPASRRSFGRRFITSKLYGRVRSASRPVLGSPVLVGFVLAVATWAGAARDLRPQDSLDLSYRASLQWAAVHSVAYGPHFAFTYGPLGFLGSDVPFFGLPAVLSFLFLTVVSASVGAVIYRALRQTLPVVAALLVAYVIMAFTTLALAPELLVPLALAWAAHSVDQPAGRRVTVSFTLAGMVTALALLIKVSLGPAVLIVFVIAWILRRQRQWTEIASFGGALVGTFLVVWLATGNSIFLIPSWLRLTSQFITGYSAMAVETPGRLYLYWLAAAVTALALALAAMRGGRTEGLWRRIGWVAMTGVALELLFRESFVRHDLHDLLFFGAAPIVIAAVAHPSRRGTLGRSVAALLVTASMFELVAIGAAPAVTARPFTGTHQWLAQGRVLFDSSSRHQAQQGGRSTLQATYQIPQAWLRQIGAQEVVAFPMGQPVGWAYPGVHWEPLPTLQAYTTYTSGLDRLDADFFNSGRAPQWVLQQSVAVDGRNPAWEAPATQLALRCRYRAVGTSPYFSLLRRIPDICGTPVNVGTVHAHLGQTIAAPILPDGSALVATIDTSPSPLGSLAALAFKGGTYSVVVNGSTRYRFVTGTGGSLHLMRFAADSGTALAITPVERLRVLSNDPWASAGDVTVRFLEIPLSS